MTHIWDINVKWFYNYPYMGIGEVMNTKAFTLSEVLITLGIIGVIAALTIPGIISKYKRISYQTAFTKAHSQMSQAVKLWRYEEGDDVYTQYYHPYDKKGEDLRNAFFKYIKGSFDTRKITADKQTIYYTSAKNSKTKAHYCPSTCCAHPQTNSYISFDGIMYNICARDGFINISFDINGYDKGPNKWGIDLFDFDMNSESEITNLYSCNRPNCRAYYHSKDAPNTTNVNDGIGCTACAIKDKDYFNKIEL